MFSLARFLSLLGWIMAIDLFECMLRLVFSADCFQGYKFPPGPAASDKANNFKHSLCFTVLHSSSKFDQENNGVSWNTGG
jgi:hypothetical protein